MNVKTLSLDYVTKYVNLLNELQKCNNSLFSLKVSMLSSVYSRIHELFENDSTSLGNCQRCLIPWHDGQFVMKTLPKKKIRNNKSKKKRRSPYSSFIMVTKCLLCLNETISVFNKNKILNKKPIKKITTPTSIKKNEDILNIKINTSIKGKNKAKKKRDPYAGLNPSVFKNKNFGKKNCKKLQ